MNKKKPFAPFPLPLQNLQWKKFISLLGEANRALAKFDASLEILPNAELLLSPLSRSEAVYSSKIEGTQATLDEVLEFEADPKENNDKYDDIREIINYRLANKLGNQLISKGAKLNMAIIKRIHQVLLQNVRGARKNPGNIRGTQVFIGPDRDINNATFIPPAPQKLLVHLQNFEKYLDFSEKDLLVQTAIVHAQFEMIHPFLDGNGRVGRILIPLFLYVKKALHKPTFYLSEYFEKNRRSYYEKLANISENQDWESWINFFLEGIIEQADKNREKIKKINDLYKELKKVIFKMPSPKNALSILDFIFSHPIFSTNRITKKLDISMAQLYRILNFLLKEKIIQSNQKRKFRIYFFYDLLKIIR